MKIVVAVDENWAIGYRGNLLFHIPEDLKHFRDITIDQVVIMGRSTLASFPNEEPLPRRENIVLSRYPALGSAGQVTTTLEDLPTVLQPYKEQGKGIYVIGGGTVYRQLLPYCSSAYVTHIKARAEQVDTFFPNLEEEENWVLVRESEPLLSGEISFTYCEYENKSPKPLE